MTSLAWLHRSAGLDVEFPRFGECRDRAPVEFLTHAASDDRSSPPASGIKCLEESFVPGWIRVLQRPSQTSGQPRARGSSTRCGRHMAWRRAVSELNTFSAPPRVIASSLGSECLFELLARSPQTMVTHLRSMDRLFDSAGISVKSMQTRDCLPDTRIVRLHPPQALVLVSTPGHFRVDMKARNLS